MNKREINHPERALPPAAYSAAVAIDGWVFVSGQGPLDMKTGKVVEGSIEEQTRLTLGHIGQILKAAGATFDDVVKCTCHLKEIQDFDRFNAVYVEFFKGIRPARTTVQSALWGGIKVEIDAIARIKA
jgi:2-iminobutanoate/2-iminopropanoate deaminase